MPHTCHLNSRKLSERKQLLVEAFIIACRCLVVRVCVVIWRSSGGNPGDLLGSLGASRPRPRRGDGNNKIRVLKQDEDDNGGGSGSGVESTTVYHDIVQCVDAHDGTTISPDSWGFLVSNTPTAYSLIIRYRCLRTAD